MDEVYSRSFSAMATACRLQLRAPAGLAAGVGSRVMLEIARIEQKYSRYRPGSLLSQINRVAAAGGEILVDDETASLLDFAYTCHRRSDGLFDITSGLLRRAWDFSADSRQAAPPAPGVIGALLPRIGLDKVVWRRPLLRFSVAGMELDFGGIGKEYAVDRAADICRNAGITSGLIDLGGDIVALGPRPDGQPWSIGLRHPRQPDALLCESPLDAGALATSGDYERCMLIGGRRYAHILHPETGWPVRGLTSVTVLAPRCMVAGGVATIALLKERRGPDWLAGTDLPHLWVDEDGRLGGSLADRFATELS